MTTAILFLVLVTGTSSEIEVDRSICREVAGALARGEPVTVDLGGGRTELVGAAACFDLPTTADPCEADA